MHEEECTKDGCRFYHRAEERRRGIFSITSLLSGTFAYGPDLCKNKDNCRQGDACRNAHTLNECTYHPLSSKVLAHSEKDYVYARRMTEVANTLGDNVYALLMLGVGEPRRNPVNFYGDNFIFSCSPCQHAVISEPGIAPRLGGVVSSNERPTFKVDFNDEDCPHGKGCGFAHRPSEQAFHPKLYKKNGCKYHKKDECGHGNLCCYRHEGVDNMQFIDSMRTHAQLRKWAEEHEELVTINTIPCATNERSNSLSWRSENDSCDDGDNCSIAATSIFGEHYNNRRVSSARSRGTSCDEQPAALFGMSSVRSRGISFDQQGEFEHKSEEDPLDEQPGILYLPQNNAKYTKVFRDAICIGDISIFTQLGYDDLPQLLWMRKEDNLASEINSACEEAGIDKIPPGHMRRIEYQLDRLLRKTDNPVHKYMGRVKQKLEMENQKKQDELLEKHQQQLTELIDNRVAIIMQDIRGELEEVISNGVDRAFSSLMKRDVS